MIVWLLLDGTLKEINPKGFNSRNAVHEYVGGSYAVCYGIVYFSNWDDLRVNKVSKNSALVAITVEPAIERG